MYQTIYTGISPRNDSLQNTHQALIPGPVEWPVLPLRDKKRCCFGRTSKSSHFFGLFPSHSQCSWDCCTKQLFQHPVRCTHCPGICVVPIWMSNTLCFCNLSWQQAPENHCPPSKELLASLNQSPDFMSCWSCTLSIWILRRLAVNSP